MEIVKVEDKGQFIDGSEYVDSQWLSKFQRFNMHSVLQKASTVPGSGTCWHGLIAAAHHRSFHLLPRLTL